MDTLINTLQMNLLSEGLPQAALGVKSPPAKVGDARDSGSIPGLESSPGEGNGDSLRYSIFLN